MNKKPAEYYEENRKKYEMKTVYSGFGWFLFTVIGMSAKPQRVEFYDRESGELIASYDDEETRKKLVGR